MNKNKVANQPMNLHNLKVAITEPVLRDFRSGDVRQRKADISKAQRISEGLGYVVGHLGQKV